LFYISGKIAKLLSASNKIVGVPRASHAWKEYTEYVNEIVIDGLSNAICASTKYLTDQTPPLLEVKLELGTAVWAFPNPGTV
jgi:dynein heavy chain